MTAFSPSAAFLKIHTPQPWPILSKHFTIHRLTATKQDIKAGDRLALSICWASSWVGGTSSKVRLLCLSLRSFSQLDSGARSAAVDQTLHAQGSTCCTVQSVCYLSFQLQRLPRPLTAQHVMHCGSSSSPYPSSHGYTCCSTWASDAALESAQSGSVRAECG